MKFFIKVLCYIRVCIWIVQCPVHTLSVCINWNNSSCGMSSHMAIHVHVHVHNYCHVCMCLPTVHVHASLLFSSLQVRVRAGVQVSSDPLVYEFGQPTDWKLADSLVEVIPSPPRKQTHNILYK